MRVSSASDTKLAQIDLLADEGLVRFKLRRALLRGMHPLTVARDSVMFSESLPFLQSGHPISFIEAGAHVPFFILGSPRSGTTMLREVLNRHPQLVIPPENGRIQGMIRVFGSLRRADWSTAVAAVVDEFTQGYDIKFWSVDPKKIKQRATALPPERRSLSSVFEVIYCAYAEQRSPNKWAWGDKSTPGHFEYLDKLGRVFPRSRFVHIVRDGRDSVLSCVRAGFYDQSAIKAAYAWLDNSRNCRLFGHSRGPERFLQVRYEDFVRDPERGIARIVEFLGYPSYPEILEPASLGSVASADVKALSHYQNAMKPISAASVGNWMHGLSPECIAAISPVLRSELRIHGYEVD